jgi:chromate reductase, NAD(P)H dehydrogenase (quinone)
VRSDRIPNPLSLHQNPDSSPAEWVKLTLPHFNPDLELTEPPSATNLCAQIKWADGLLISSPEYAHGVPGVLKNALDWLVSGEKFLGKAIALINASPRAT